jgi:hypothetical protein
MVDRAEEGGEGFEEEVGWEVVGFGHVRN